MDLDFSLRFVDRIIRDSALFDTAPEDVAASRAKEKAKAIKNEIKSGYKEEMKAAEKGKHKAVYKAKKEQEKGAKAKYKNAGKPIKELEKSRHMAAPGAAD